MAISVLDIFKVGIGPSSSHTVGPMRAARTFAAGLQADGLLESTVSIRAELFGSLGATGHGHGSPKAVILGLLGAEPDHVDVDHAETAVDQARSTGSLALMGSREIAFDVDKDIVMHRRKSLPFHPNGMTFSAFGADGESLRERTYYSVGGGFVVDEAAAGAERIKIDDRVVPYPFRTGDELLAHANATGLPFSSIMLANEAAWRPEAETRAALLHIWDVMQSCVKRGYAAEGVLPGSLKVVRRAPAVHRALSNDPDASDPLHQLDWVNLFALAVNEENAAGGRVVTAPTNGAAGVVPAVLHYYRRFVRRSDDEGVLRFLLTAGAIGVIYLETASISGAEVGCQGEVGSACSMAAGALCEVLGGTPGQVENAAEIGMEHNLGLTCDPVGGLVQIPCIERNAMGAVKAINAARMALSGDGSHFVSLDKVIKTMRQTGMDMKVIYKETSRGGLAVNVIEC